MTGFYASLSHLIVSFCIVQIVPQLIGQTSGVCSTCHLEQKLSNNLWNDFMLLQVRHQLCVGVNKKYFFQLTVMIIILNTSTIRFQYSYISCAIEYYHYMHTSFYLIPLTALLWSLLAEAVFQVYYRNILSASCDPAERNLMGLNWETVQSKPLVRLFLSIFLRSLP